VDINRDAHQLTQETTKAVAHMFFDWHPTVIHDLHEGEPFLMSWNGTGPYNPNVDPITFTEFLALSFHEVQTLTGLGMPGVSTWNFGEGFAELFLDSVAMNHNSIGRGYETLGNGSAETLTWLLSGEETSREWYRPLPPTAGKVSWSARDNGGRFPGLGPSIIRICFSVIERPFTNIAFRMRSAWISHVVSPGLIGP